MKMFIKGNLQRFESKNLKDSQLFKLKANWAKCHFLKQEALQKKPFIPSITID